MSPSPSRTIPPSFGQSLFRRQRQSWQRTRDDDSDDDDDDDDNSSSTSTSHSRSPQSTHSQSSQHDGHNSSQVTSGTGTSHAGAIAGGIIAGIIVLAILAFFWWRRRAPRNRPNVKIEIDPMSTLNGEAYAWKKTEPEEQSLIHERSSTVGADLSPRSIQPQFWQVHNVDANMTDDMHDAPIPRSVPGVENMLVAPKFPIGKNPGEKSKKSTSTINLIPVPEKDFRDYRVGSAGASSSKAGSQSPYSSNDSTKGTTEKDGYSMVKGSSTLHDSQGPSAWKEKEELKQTYDSPVSDSGSQRSMRRFSELEANDLALAAREEVSDLRRWVELLKQENADLTRTNSGSSFERPPAYKE
ncbi:hypothetical protein EV368DRAFT_83428 [Lentinula lateritia]|nr:hypothetical protein EV368DRAFT_83428 [Lentinula lateritia]